MAQRNSDISDLGRIFGSESVLAGGAGGGGRYRPSLADVWLVASEKKVADLFEAAEASFRPLFDDYDAVDGGTAAFRGEVVLGDESSLTELLRLEVAESRKRKGLAFRIDHDQMLRYLGTEAEALPDLQLAFGAKRAQANRTERTLNTGWFRSRSQIQRAADYVAEKVIQRRRAGA